MLVRHHRGQTEPPFPLENQPGTVDRMPLDDGPFFVGSAGGVLSIGSGV